MSRHDDHDRGHHGGHHGGQGAGLALVGMLMVWVLFKESAGPAAHAVGRELTSGVPVVDLPFKLLAWAWDNAAGDVGRRLLGKDD